MVIYKYRVPNDTNAPIILMPPGARILSVAEQVTGPSGGKDVFIWALINTKVLERSKRLLRIITTGSEFSDDGSYLWSFIGTLHLRYPNGANCVLHFFDAGEIL